LWERGTRALKRRIPSQRHGDVPFVRALDDEPAAGESQSHRANVTAACGAVAFAPVANGHSNASRSHVILSVLANDLRK
jgi:hypothetical protein